MFMRIMRIMRMMTTTPVRNVGALLGLVLLYCLSWARASVLESMWAVSPSRPSSFLANHNPQEPQFVRDASRRRWEHWHRTTTTIDDDNDNDNTFPGTSQGLTEIQLIHRVKMWPPWPLSLWQRPDREDHGEEGDHDHIHGTKSKNNEGVTAANTYPSAAAVALVWCSQRARIGVRQLKEVGSTLWFHLPPALPPLLVAACVPRRRMETGLWIPLFKDPFARTLILGGFGVAVLSWAHQELHRKRKLTPLVGVPQPVSRVFLPPFLPEMVPEPEIEALQHSNSHNNNNNNNNIKLDDETSEESSQILSMLSPRFRKHLSDIYENSPLKHDNPLRFRGFFKERRRKQEVRKRETAKIRRLTIFDQLVALQAIKRKSKAQRGDAGRSKDLDRGYALVTGASQGIGRAMAVELARWEIPLVLVARDVDRLTSLAYDLEACYGVRCCVLQADLAEWDAPERIFETTKEAGLTIDILVNNAGIAYEGLSTDMETSAVERMIVINAMSFAKLSKLYGQDMKERGRGRMLMVSSMAGITSASPNTALYGATKAFEKSLSLSMSKELEPYGVGVTCIMPGPVTDTEFRVRSGTTRSLCWYIPFYPRSAQTVAHQGIMSLLDGDTQVIPGWQNRAFVHLLRPVLPQRVETMCVEAAWSPFTFPSLKGLLGIHPPTSSRIPIPKTQQDVNHERNTSTIDSHQLDLRPRYNFQLPPRLLKLPVPEVVIDVPPVIPPTTLQPDRDANDTQTEEEQGTGRDPGEPPLQEQPTDLSMTHTSYLQQDLEMRSVPEGAEAETGHDTVSSSSDKKSDLAKHLLSGKSAPSQGTTREGSVVRVSPIASTEDQDSTNEEISEEDKASSSVPTQTLGTGLRRLHTKNNDLESSTDEYDNIDSTMSPRLGPIDLLRDSRPHTTLPNTKTDGQLKWSIEA